MSSLAAARCTRKGNKTDSVLAASVAVQDHGAAASSFAERIALSAGVSMMGNIDLEGV